MKRLLVLASALACAMLVAPVAAEEKTIAGEVIDMKCGQGTGHEACATACVRRGEPVGIKTADGTVYLVVGDFTADKNTKLVEFVAKQVEATGEVGDASGQKTIAISKIALKK